jgi:signal transduction histidine kinase
MKRRDPAREREYTDASLDRERTRTDDELAARTESAGETADAVIGVARARARAVLDAARAREDAGEPMTPALAAIRAAEDATLRSEYDAADLALRDERARRRLAVRQLLALERRATDETLSAERALVDDTMIERAMLDVLVHDLRSMMSVMSLNAASIILAADRGEPVSLLVDLAGHIQRAIAQSEVLLGDLHELAKINSGHARISPTDGDVVEVVRAAVDVHQAAAEANGITLAAELPAVPIIASIDAPRFMRVVVNLLSNALKFTPEGGAVRVTVARRGDAIEVGVRDTGPGVPAELQAVIFDRFQQGPDATARGLGLGLYIARAIVEAHGGKIWVESRRGAGATFRVQLPARA